MTVPKLTHILGLLALSFLHSSTIIWKIPCTCKRNQGRYILYVGIVWTHQSCDVRTEKSLLNSQNTAQTFLGRHTKTVQLDNFISTSSTAQCLSNGNNLKKDST